MNKELHSIVENNLLLIMKEISEQPDVSVHFPVEQLSYQAWIEQQNEWIQDVGEYGIAYESLISALEVHPFVLSGIASVKLLEVGLLFKFKTEDEQDRIFDSRI
ncbi:MAG TPA: hypothetical protein VL995_00220 [Cellvibrio sp.]|nr:hypothetical protein [Cellvibrio sp.]